MFFISAPFGNYLNFKNAISVTGTFTVHPRPGRLLQIIKTLRYTKDGWRNKLGVRNPGIHKGMWNTKYNQVMSIAALEPDDWNTLIDTISAERNIELNISCPNLDACRDTMNWKGFEKFPKHMRGKWCIVKVPPIANNSMIDKLIDLGYKQIHASNTVPTDKGGLSGKIITPYTMRIIDYIKNKYPHAEIIAGGGVYSKQDAIDYLNAGADHISLGSVSFTPWKIKSIIT